jgi:predicted nucleotidyltransferase
VELPASYWYTTRIICSVLKLATNRFRLEYSGSCLTSCSSGRKLIHTRSGYKEHTGQKMRQPRTCPFHAPPQSTPHFSDRTAFGCSCCLPPWPMREASALRKTRNQFTDWETIGGRELGERAMYERTMPGDTGIVTEFAERVTRRFGDRITRMVFFGSRAHGYPKPDSDYDILLVVRERNQALIDQLYDEALDVLLQSGVELSLKIYTEEMFQKGLACRNPFLCSVATTGVELWNAKQKS